MLANRRVVTRLVKRLLNGMIHQVTKCALAYNGKTRKSGHFHGVLGIYCPYRTKKIKVSVFWFLLLLFVVLRYVYHKPQKLLSSVCQVGGSSLPPEKYTRKSMEIIGPFVARYSMSGSKGFCYDASWVALLLFAICALCTIYVQKIGTNKSGDFLYSDDGCNGEKNLAD